MQKYLEHTGKGSTVADALNWLRELDGSSPIPMVQQQHNKDQSIIPSKESPYRMLANTPLKSPVLFQYLKKRKISFSCAGRHLRQLYFIHRSSKKKVFGFGFENRSRDYDFGNPLGFKSCLGKKDISFIAGSKTNNTVEVFEGFMDYLTRLTIEGKPELENDVVVLNSTSMTLEFIQLSHQHKYKNILLWLDNDSSGHKASNSLIDDLKDSKINISLMNEIYNGFKDLNQWHTDSQLSSYEKKTLITEFMKRNRIINSPELSLSV